MFVTNWISTTKIQKISEITNFFRHYFLSRTEVYIRITYNIQKRHKRGAWKGSCKVCRRKNGSISNAEVS